MGRPGFASSHNLRLISAMARKSDRPTLPSRGDLAVAHFVPVEQGEQVAQQHADKQHADEDRQLEDAAPGDRGPAFRPFRLMAMSARVSIRLKVVSGRSMSGISKPWGRRHGCAPHRAPAPSSPDNGPPGRR